MHIIRHMDCINYIKRHFRGAFLQTQRKHFSFIAAIAVLTVYYYLIGCPIKYFCGIPCLGCGMTRAWIQVFFGDIRAAFYFHPLWPSPILFILLYMFLRPKNKLAYNRFIMLIVLLFSITYAVRMYVHSPIVEINLHDGFIYKVLIRIKNVVR